MDKVAHKQEVLNAARERQSSIVDDFKTRIDDLNGIEYITEEDQHDLDQQAANQSNKEMIAVLTREMNFAQEELDFLNKMIVPDQPLEQAVIGAVVVTDKKTFYPSVSIENFTVGDKEIFGISKKAPLFAEMEGKKVGDTFGFRDYNYTILDIY